MIENSNSYLYLNEFESYIPFIWKELQMKKEFCDVTFSCGNKQILAHKIVVASSSVVLKHTLEQHPKNHPFIYFKGVKFKNLQDMITLMYQGEVSITNDDIDSFLDMAEKLKVIGISKERDRYHEKNTSPFKKSIIKLQNRNDEKSNYEKDSKNKIHNKEHEISEMSGTYRYDQNSEYFMENYSTPNKKNFINFQNKIEYNNTLDKIFELTVNENINMSPEIEENQTNTEKCIDKEELDNIPRILQHHQETYQPNDVHLYQLKNDKENLKQENINTFIELKKESSQNTSRFEEESNNLIEMNNTNITKMPNLHNESESTDSEVFEDEVLKDDYYINTFIELKKESSQNTSCFEEESNNLIEMNNTNVTKMPNLHNESESTDSEVFEDEVLKDDYFQKDIDKEKYDMPIYFVKKKKKFSCNLCDKKYYNSTNLKQHKESVHEGIWYSCNQCEYKGTVKTLLKFHIATMHEHTSVSCDICNKQYIDSKNLIKHKETHKGVFPCDQCTYKSTEKDDLLDHRQKRHNYKIEKQNLMESSEALNIKKQWLSKKQQWLCDKCDKVYTSQRGLKAHKIAEHNGVRYPCDQCEYKAKEKAKLRNHVESIHEKHLIPCNQCDKLYSNSTSLHRHKEVKHRGIRYPCTQCLKSFNQREGLQIHMRVHSGEKPYPCTECPKAFKMSGALKVHTRIHSGEKPFSCNQCPNAFSESGTLRRHMKVHSGENPFYCTQCPMKFSGGGNLKKHMRTHSGL